MIPLYICLSVMLTTASLPRIQIPPCFINEPSILTDWKYDKRKEAQQLLPYLWLGPMSVLRDEQFLANHNIHVLISLLSGKATVALLKHRYSGSPNYRCFSFDPGDSLTNAAALVKEFPRINDAIDFAQENRVSALLFCETGNDSSAVAAIAYMIYHRQFDTVRAYQYVQSKRFSIALDDQSKYNLQTYEGYCRAKALIGSANMNGSKKSRRLEDDEDEDNLLFQKYRIEDDSNTESSHDEAHHKYRLRQCYSSSIY